MHQLKPEPIRKLAATDSLDHFDCGQIALNQFLQRHALNNQRANSAQTYVCCVKGKIAGFYSLAVGSLAHKTAPERISKGLARHPIPVMILARLAVDQAWQGKGLGRALLKNALLRTIQAADIAGIQAIIAHAKDEKARHWYKGFDFVDGPADPYQLFLLLKDLKSISGKG